MADEEKKEEKKPDAKADAKPEGKPEGKPQGKPEGKPQGKPEGKPEAKAEGDEPKTAAKKGPRAKKLVTRAIVHIQATFNNTIITITDMNGETLCWASAGHIGYKGSRKSTPFAAQKAAESVADKAQKFGVREVEVRIKGPGAGRESAIRALQNMGLHVRAIEDVTPLPHNGCRPRKKRRV